MRHLLMGHVASIVEMRPEEAAVVAELKAGSEDAYASLIAQYHQPVYSLVARILTNADDAPDVTQDVFVKVFRNIGGFHGQSSLRTWIYRIALHEAYNQRRWWFRHKAQEVTIEVQASESEDAGPRLCWKDALADERQSPFESAAKSEMRALVESALRKVPEPFRTVVVLRDLEGLAYEEIAEVLHVRVGTVKSRLMRGRATLRQSLAEFFTVTGPRTGRETVTVVDKGLCEEAV